MLDFTLHFWVSYLQHNKKFTFHNAVADTVMVTSKHNDDKQHIWESNGGEFTIAEDPRGASLLRGTTVRLLCTKFLFIHFSVHHFSLFMKEEAQEFLDQSTLKELIRKYSQFINFPIYLWDSKTETVEEPIEVTTSFIPYP